MALPLLNAILSAPAIKELSIYYTLRSLDLCPIFNLQHSSLTDFETPSSLQTLSLSSIANVDVESVVAIFRKSPNLQTVRFHETEFPDGLIKKITPYSSKIKCLQFSNVGLGRDFWTDVSCDLLPIMENLNELSFKTSHRPSSYPSLCFFRRTMACINQKRGINTFTRTLKRLLMDNLIFDAYDVYAIFPLNSLECFIVPIQCGQMPPTQELMIDISSILNNCPNLNILVLLLDSYGDLDPVRVERLLIRSLMEYPTLHPIKEIGVRLRDVYVT